MVSSVTQTRSVSLMCWQRDSVPAFLFRNFTGEGAGGKCSQSRLLVSFITLVKAGSSEVFLLKTVLGELASVEMGSGRRS